MTKQRAVLIDIDDVLCDSRASIKAHVEKCLERNGEAENPFEPEHWHDWDPSGLEPLGPWVALTNVLFEAVSVILLTSRHDQHRPVAEAWLDKHGVQYDLLYMWDGQVDYFEYKGLMGSSLLEEYDILLAIDDSQGHCEAYRRAGIPFIHVHPDALR